MIVRILGRGPVRGARRAERAALDELDAALVEAVDGGDEAGVRRCPGRARSPRCAGSGTPLAADAFAPSDLVVPFADASLEETKALLADPARADRIGRPLRTEP